MGAQTYIGHVLVSVNPFRDCQCHTLCCEDYKRLISCSGYLYRGGAGLLQRKESPGNPTSRFRRRRIGVLQHESLQRQSMCHHIWGVGSRENGSRQAYNAVHRQCIRRERFFDPGDQRDGVGYKSVTGIIRQCEDAQEQQFFSVWEVPGTAIQRAGRTCRSKHYELSFGEIESRGSDYE